MNKYGLFFGAVLFLSQVSFAANPIIFQQATSKDVTQLLDLYTGFTQDDADRLVVFPIEVREVFLRKNITDGRIFVAKDASKVDSPIVSFCKLFMVEDEEELVSIVRDELLAVSGDMEVNRPHKAAQFFFPPTFATDFETMPVEVAGSAEAYELSLSDTYIYYGGSYTRPDYRKHGICTALERYALDVLRPVIVRRVQKLGGNLLYACGVVLANYGGLARPRSFVQFAQKIALDAGIIDASSHDDLSFMIYDFDACKPTFRMAGDKLEGVLEEKGKGYGCFIRCNMSVSG